MVGATITINGLDETVSSLVEIREGWSGDHRWIVGVGAEYGAYVEFGTYKMTAQPYLFPAVKHVIRSQFRSIEKAATDLGDLIKRLANAIEYEAKKRAPVKTGNLMNSIKAAEAGSFR